MMHIWNKTDNLLFPGGLYTPAQVFEVYPWTEYVDTLLETTGGVTGAIDNLPFILSQHGLDDTLTGQAALDAITAAKEAEAAAQAAAAEEAATTPDATERIAAALEYQTLATLPDQA